MHGKKHVDVLFPGHHWRFAGCFWRRRTVVLRDVQVFHDAIQPRQDRFSRRRMALLRSDSALKDPFRGGFSRRYAIRTSVLTPILSAATSWVKVTEMTALPASSVAGGFSYVSVCGAWLFRNWHSKRRPQCVARPNPLTVAAIAATGRVLSRPCQSRVGRARTLRLALLGAIEK